VHLVAGAEHAFRVADVRALDLDDFREDGRTVAYVASNSRRSGRA